jgi:hypothetical protein
MSRSNPTDNTPNPAVRWFEWDGQNGCVRYYDKEAKGKEGKQGANVAVKDGFTFLLLDETSTIKGWNDAAEAGIFANEVRDTRQEVFVVKMFDKARTRVAEGPYAAIKDRVHAVGGHFVTTCYIAYKPGKGLLSIAGLQLKGAALRTWMEFKKHCKRSQVKNAEGKMIAVPEYYIQAVQISGYTEGKKGTIVFRTPNFALLSKGVTAETQAQALALDEQLQDYLKGYFARTKVAAAQPPPDMAAQADGQSEAPQGDAPSDNDVPPGAQSEPEPEQDDIPF